LPVLGGAPSVWAVAMFFFQSALLAGYCYAHFLIAKIGPRKSGLIHLGLCAFALIALPIGLPAWFGEPPAGEPYLWQLGLFTVAVGLPFMAVAANAPLLQAWFASTGHAQGRDPYFLYAASNLGSLIALLGYPFLLEPLFGVRTLSFIWTVGYVVLAALIAMAAYIVRNRMGGEAGAADEAKPEWLIEVTRPKWPERLSWIGLALVPSALLTAFTTHVTTDVASAPLLWVIPLALYLLTFVFVFREKPILVLPLIALGLLLAWSFGSTVGDWLRVRTGFAITAQRGWAIGVISAAIIAIGIIQWLFRVRPMAWLLALHIASVIGSLLLLAQTNVESWFVTAPMGLAVFFTSAMVAHRTLYERRPAAQHLTEFYLWMSLGGALGGLAAALLAPKIFSQLFEYPLLLALSVACRPRALAIDRKDQDRMLILWLVASIAVLALYWLPHLLNWVGITGGLWGMTFMIALAMALIILVAWRFPPAQLIGALGMVAAVSFFPSGVNRATTTGPNPDVVARSYFGIYRVRDYGQYRALVHGTTLHGAQRIRDNDGSPVNDITPATYYHEGSPMARALVTRREVINEKGRTEGRYAVIGLGAGSLACYATTGEKWRFYEIDPTVLDLARDPKNFTFISECQPKIDVVIGDARLTIAKEPDKSFDIIVVDAFSSDAVPIHLMTAEAIALYMRKIADDGVFVLHISNRYLDLDAVLGATAPAVPGLHGILISDDSSDGSYGQSSSTVAIFGKSREALEPYKGLGTLEELPEGKMPPWTDDYSDVLRPFILKMRRRFG
ncbi:MAG: hypothetical protein RL291_2060, partial [Pseudomonadota bacterium]